MNIEEKESQLLLKRGTLDDEIKDIKDEVIVLLALIKKAQEEIETINAKLCELEDVKKIKFAKAS